MTYSRVPHSFAHFANEWVSSQPDCIRITSHFQPCDYSDRVTKHLHRGQRRFFDFNNPVKRGLVERPEQWKWSSFRAYCDGETGPVRVKSQEWALEIKCRRVHIFAEVEHPLIRKASVSAHHS